MNKIILNKNILTFLSLYDEVNIDNNQLSKERREYYIRFIKKNPESIFSLIDSLREEVKLLRDLDEDIQNLNRLRTKDLKLKKSFDSNVNMILGKISKQSSIPTYFGGGK